jgi:hypothetical protein
MKSFVFIFSLLFITSCETSKSKDSIVFIHNDYSLIKNRFNKIDTIELDDLINNPFDWEPIFKNLILCDKIISEVFKKENGLEILSVECENGEFLLFNDKNFGLIKIHRLSETRIDEYILFKSGNNFNKNDLSIKLIFVDEFLRKQMKL